MAGTSTNGAETGGREADRARTHSRHAALALELMDSIASGGFPPGSRFPSEKELQAEHEVGRHTVREALKILTEQGLIGRRRKTGTVVLSQSPVSHYVHSLRNIRTLLDFAQSTSLDIRYIGFGSNRGTGNDFEGLPDRRWLRIAGLRSTRSTSEPLCWSEIFVPQQLAPDRETIGSSGRAVYEIVMEQHNLKLDHVEQVITAMVLPRPLAPMFGVETGSAALMVKRRYVAHGGKTFEISHNLYPADRYSMHTIIRQRV